MSCELILAGPLVTIPSGEKMCTVFLACFEVGKSAFKCKPVENTCRTVTAANKYVAIEKGGLLILKKQRTLSLWAGMFFLCCLLISLPKNAKAEDGKIIWAPPEALLESYDWIQLTSGEWLMGDLKVMYDRSLEFDSEKLDFQTFDWEDVQQVICYESKSIQIEDPNAKYYHLIGLGSQIQIIVGILRVKGNKVFLETDEGTLEFDRSSLVSIAPGEVGEWDNWAVKLTLSVNLTGGNTENEDYSANLNLKRGTSINRFYFDYRGIYSEASNVATSNTHRANGHFDIFSRWFFYRPVFVEYYRDLFANLAHRGTIGTGVGYTIIDTDKADFHITPGLAYIYTAYDSVETGEDETASTPALVVSAYLDTEVTDKIDFLAFYSFNVVNEESGTYIHHAKTSLEFEITGYLDFDLSLIWDRIQDPAPDENGIVPEQDDFYFFCGLTFKL